MTRIYICRYFVKLTKLVRIRAQLRRANSPRLVVPLEAKAIERKALVGVKKVLAEMPDRDFNTFFWINGY
jgi:hypothetical protein